MKKINQLLFKNLSLKITALLLAFLFWAIISGREKTFAERTLKIPVEVVNVPGNIEARTVRPEEVRITLQGPANVVNELNPENLGIRIDLKDVFESSKLNFFSEDYINIPAGIKIVSIHPKMIEIYAEEFVTKVVPVKLRWRGKLRDTLRLKETKFSPETVAVIVYQSQDHLVTQILSEEIDLAEIERTATLKVPLRQTTNVLKFVDRKDVDVAVVIEKK